AVVSHEPGPRLVAVVLRIHRHEHVGRLAAVGRDLGARHPAEREQIAVRDSALLCGERYHTAGGGESTKEDAHGSVPRRLRNGGQRIRAPERSEERRVGKEGCAGGEGWGG